MVTALLTRRFDMVNIPIFWSRTFWYLHRAIKTMSAMNLDRKPKGIKRVAPNLGASCYLIKHSAILRMHADSHY